MIESLFERARACGRRAFIPYIMAGDPDLETTERILAALTRAGVTAVELGIPYGDPLADGPTIAAAAQRALERGTSLDDVLALVRRHAMNNGAPIVLFTYYNPIYQYGLEAFAGEAAAAGACGAIVPDIPLEEGAELGGVLARHGIDMPLLVAPSTTPQRAARIVEQSTGFIYVVSRLGVTGAGTMPATQRLREQVATLRSMTRKPLAVGFGVSQPDQVREVASFADGIIVGSALIDAYQGTRGEEAASRVTRFVEPLLAASEREETPVPKPSLQSR